MDPVSAIGLLGSVIGIVDVITKSISYLSGLQSSYKIVDLKVWLMIGQLSTLKAALNQVAELIDLRPDIPRDNKLVNDLSVALCCVETVISAVDNRLSDLQKNENQGLKALSKVSFVWDEQTINDYLSLLNNQVNALNLFLTALQCRTTVEQAKLVEEPECQSLLRIIRDDTSSLLWLRDSESIGTYKSAVPQDFATINTTFGFDTEVFASKAYRTATRSNMLHSLFSDAPQDDHNHVVSGRRGGGLRSLPGFFGDGPEKHSETRNAELRRSISPSALPKHTVYTLEALQRLPLGPAPDTASSLSITQQQRAGGRNARLHAGWLTQSYGESLREKTDVKVLITGISESGKSTLYESLQLRYMGAYRDKAWVCYKSVIRENLFSTTRIVAEIIKRDGEVTESILQQLSGDKQTFMAACDLLAEPTLDIVEQIKARPAGLFSLNEDISSAIQAVWNETQSYRVLEKAVLSPSINIMDSANRFASSSNRILDSSYLPTDEDIFYARKENHMRDVMRLVHDDTAYDFYDLGGSRLERMEWIHDFSNVKSIIFTCDVSCYDSVLLEENTQNRMREQILLFESLVSSDWFIRSQVVVLFTKEDKLTAERLLVSPFQAVFPDYDGHPGDVEDIINYLVFRLRRCARNETTEVVFCRSDSIASSMTSMGEVAMHAIQRRGNFPPDS